MLLSKLVKAKNAQSAFGPGSESPRHNSGSKLEVFGQMRRDSANQADSDDVEAMLDLNLFRENLETPGHPQYKQF